MATKETIKGIKASSRTARSEGGAEKAGASRPTLRVSHGTKATSSKARAPARAPATTPSPPGVRAPSVPPRARRASKASAPAGEAGQLALTIAAAALDKKAGDVEIIDLGGKADYADYLVVMTGGSDRHVRALADGIQETLGRQKVRPLSVEGQTGGSWILLDFGTVVAHVFQENVRALYDIEGLWLDAARLPVPASR